MLFWPIWSTLVFVGNTILPPPVTPSIPTPSITAKAVTISAPIPTLTYTTALQYAYSLAPDIRIARAEYKLAQALEAERVMSLLPEVALNYQGYYTKEFDRGEQTFFEQITNPRQPKYKNNASLSVNFWLWRSEVNPNDLDHAKLTTKTAALALTRAKKDLALQLLDSWTQVVSNQSEARILSKILDELSAKRGQLERLNAEKLINANDYLTLQIQLEQRRETYQMTLRSLGINRAELGFMISQTVSDSTSLAPITLPTTLLAQIPESVTLHQIPELAELDVQLEKNELEKKQTIGKLLPQVRLTTEYTLYGTDSVAFNTALANLKRNTALAGVVMTWSLSDILAMPRTCTRLDREREVIDARKARALSDTNRILAGAISSYRAHQHTTAALNSARQTAELRTQNTIKLNAEKLISSTAQHDDAITQLEAVLAAEKAEIQYTRDRLAAWLVASPETTLTQLLGPDKDALDTPKIETEHDERTDQ